MKITDSTSGTHVYELFAGSRKIGICVARSVDEALLFATNATTRKTSSKMETSCDYEQISARLFGNGVNGIDTMKTELSSLPKCNSFGSVPITDVGLLSFTTHRYNDTRAPLAIQCWMDHGEGYSDPYGKITHGYPHKCDVAIESDEVVVKTDFENETLRDPLLASGYFADTGKRIPSGHLSLEVWKMQPSFAQAFRQQNACNTH